MTEALIWVYFWCSVGLIFIILFFLININFGETYLLIKVFLKQQFCIHRYKTVIRKDYGGGDFQMCIKCEKTK